ncbi:MAG: Seryl-tRNA synthetase [Candidatus Parvarchaeum acidophilus ARMAN-5_'5-way FS']|jgi:seryl-tRNA synthetase|uniref:Serine--tRNA ligase n=2 Tax=Parvarchaeum acidophilus TaxID=662761 RepID=D6GW55_PARA5|nr:MAG: seryl-tRNA synthetase [Candidatus Parvarchaeum acidophilus ARMAN-5]EGD71938.1 MAG: Seryl-tRNA synthetase [Candidatus Parvarchaeum acidophilus ARMAN-5_'5-way FS']
MDYNLNYVSENKEALEYSIKKRYIHPIIENPVQRLIDLNNIIKKERAKADELRHNRNVISKQFSENKDDIDSKEEQRMLVRKNMEQIKEMEEEIEKYEKEAKELFLWLPNVVSKDAPDGKDDNDNVEVRKYGNIEDRKFEVKNHIDLGLEKGLIDVESAAKVTGSRFAYIKGKLVQLELALELYSIEKIASKGFTPIIPPFMIKRDIYGGIAHMATFEDALYKVTGIEEQGEEERFLISTTEHPLIAQYTNSTINENELPIKLVGVSSAFRKEAGAHGKDTKGIFRMHQFEQTEQIVLCKPEDSDKFHEEMVKNVEEIWKELNIPYRVVSCSTGDMGVRDFKQYDIEAYLYSQKKYREVGSFDNTTDWISRRLNIKYADKEGNKHYLYTLDGTGLPIQRTIIAIMDTYQQPNGTIKVPDVLKKFVGFSEI